MNLVVWHRAQTVIYDVPRPEGALPAGIFEHANRLLGSVQASGNNSRSCSELCKIPGGEVEVARQHVGPGDPVNRMDSASEIL